MSNEIKWTNKEKQELITEIPSIRHFFFIRVDINTRGFA